MTDFLGFNFYGAGNIGDDLMVAGFIEGYLNIHQRNTEADLCQSRLKSQILRFPAIRWKHLSANDRKLNLSQCNAWVGVGGTPFQASSGTWMLEHICEDLSYLKNSASCLMVGIGCESEVVKYSGLARKILARADWISTRDSFSAHILTKELGANPGVVSVGADLANITLSQIFSNTSNKLHLRRKMGIIYYDEHSSPASLSGLRQFAARIHRSTKVVFVANDTRRFGYERSCYHKMFPATQFISHSLTPFWPSFYSPNYKKSNLNSLVSHFSSYECVFASRYHAILTAAWAGCRVAAINRSSKIRQLAHELRIPLVSYPLTDEKLLSAYEKACLVSRSLLNSLERRARESLDQFAIKIASGEM